MRLAVLLVLAPLVFSTTAAGAPKRITGKLSKPGYTIVALDRDGRASLARAGPKFKLKPTAKRVTLHLRARNGTYAGPIVAAREEQGKRAVVGVRAGAKLGAVTVKRRKGFAKVERDLPDTALERVARPARGRVCRSVLAPSAACGLNRRTNSGLVATRTATASPARSTWTTTAT